jgi:transcriptional regulator with XRE-family HTH domain
LRLVREERGFSLREVARFINVSPSTYSLIERGHHPCYPAWRERLERLLNVSSGELLTPVAPETMTDSR